MAVTDNDVAHLARCVELAREALENGDEPFGSILVDADGATQFEAQVKSLYETRLHR